MEPQNHDGDFAKFISLNNDIKHNDNLMQLNSKSLTVTASIEYSYTKQVLFFWFFKTGAFNLTIYFHCSLKMFKIRKKHIKCIYHHVFIGKHILREDWKISPTKHMHCTHKEVIGWKGGLLSFK